MSARASFLFLLSAAAGLAGCASISSPQGGPRDTVPPKLVRSVPANGARNSRTQVVRLEFSEAVQLKDLQKNLIIAPTIPDDNKYKVREERNAISLVFDKPLDENTTYSFNFGNAISDITESLPATDARVSFSTGAVLDSGAVVGTVRTLLTQQPADAAAVLLYPEADTAGLRRGKPYYLARTDKSGAYSLRNLKAGRYRLYALLDKNQNTRYDDGEKIAYLPQPITVGARPDTVRLELVRPDARRPVVSGQQAAPTQFRVSYNEGLRTVVLAPLGAAATAPLAEALQLQEQGRAVALYRTAALQEGRYLLAATDSAGNTSRDTINVKFQGTAPTRRPPVYSVEGSPREVYRQGEVRFVFTEPVRVAASKPAVLLQEDSTTRRALPLGPEVKLSPDRSRLTVLLNTKAKTTVTLRLDTLNVTTISGQRLGARPLRLRVTEQSGTGSVAGTIQTKYTRYDVQLLDAQGAVAATLESPRNTFRFDRLAPGTYTIRVLIDADADGRWRSADPLLLQPAEPVYLLPQPVQIRANWEVEDIRLAF
ncbi:Ig-like domain-containing domain [Hymenobacter yonginensis]|uniref:Ig-like domain-containing domain n=1 Tax=Hymenobacter yonginensis TaxID=748197 RepID=A0ABY7PLN1_9BACT|nr:Ig-like domain-containing domain [Hymenobacter yonginensis]WBO84111.1 Ig-like domain-containing domain [Hymenobacter yonginensis]